MLLQMEVDANVVDENNLSGIAVMSVVFTAKQEETEVVKLLIQHGGNVFKQMLQVEIAGIMLVKLIVLVVWPVYVCCFV